MAPTAFVVLLLAGISAQVTAPAPEQRRPHIIVIVADDLGWNDVSFHGSDQIPTPNIDSLAYNGVILNNHYALPLCTPSRAALLTSKYPVRIGMQHNVILEPEPWGLPLRERLLPQYLKDLGYATHAVGKWHLGFFKSEYTPTYRGFDSHFGYWNGHQDYYSHNVQSTFAPYEGYDMRRNMSVARDAEGHYSTRLFTQETIRLVLTHDVSRPLFLYLAHLAVHAGNYEHPLQAPEETLALYAHIKDPERRHYAAMLHELDQSVGAVLQALQERGMLENSVVLFLSDNGAPTRGIHANHGSNWPLKGVKATPWEGGVRVPACVWSATLRKPRRVANQLMHITDWMPTLLGLAGANTSQLDALDGMDVWRAVDEDLPSPRQEVLLNLDDASAYAAVRVRNLKYVNGRTLRLVPRLFMRLVTRVPGPAGTSLLGFLDEWHPQPRSDLDPPYDGNAVLSSAAARALRAASVSAAAALSASARGPSLPALDTGAVRALRAAATVRCTGRNPRAKPCRPRQQPCLFDVARDPCEERNLYTPEMGALFEARLRHFRLSAVAPCNRRADKRADPARWGGVWSPWADGLEE